MSDIYLVSPDYSSAPMQRVHCKDEISELQDLLHRNPNLLPGAQISPEDPRRWLLVCREMGIPDLAQGIDRWSVDFLYVDQSGIPTFVECKRYRDTRARREVIGQMLEYAANGQRYWSAEQLREFAGREAAAHALTLEQALQRLQPDEDEAPGAFFERVLANLREGVLRLVFLMEEAPPELASIVEFLNNQMERTEVLLVEVRQFTDGQVKIAVPILVGYTEQARQVKQPISIVVPSAGPSKRHRWNATEFFEVAANGLHPTQLELLRAIHSYATESPYDIKWGNGAVRGSFGLRLPEICQRTLITVYTDGHLALNFGWYNGNPEAEALRDRLRQSAIAQLKLPIGDDYLTTFPEFPIERWEAQTENLIHVLSELSRNRGRG